MLPVSLPSRLEIDCYSVAFVAYGELILLTWKKQMARWKIEKEAHFRISAIITYWQSYRSPLIVGTEVYIANYERVERYSLKVLLLE